MKQLNLVYSTPPEDEFICVGEGQQVGTTHFCKIHDCSIAGSKLCYYPLFELVKFANEEGEIPIKGWGTIPVTMYGAKENELEKLKKFSFQKMLSFIHIK